MSRHQSVDNPYLHDNFAPVRVETTATDLPPRATVVATISPAEPPPSTTTSYVSMGRSTFLLFPCPMAPRAVGVARRSDVSDSSMHLDRPQSMQYHPLMFHATNSPLGGV